MINADLIFNDDLARAYVGIRETPETAAGIHDGDHVHKDSSKQKYQIDLRCQVPHEKRPRARAYS